MRFELAAPAHALERGRNDARVVEDQRVAGAQELRQLAHDARSSQRRRRGRTTSSARGVARARRMQRDPVLGQLEVEQVRAHQ